MNLKERRAAALKAAQDILDGAKAAGRDVTDEEFATLEAKRDEVKSLDEQILQATKRAGVFDDLKGLAPEDGKGGTDARDQGRDQGAKSLGEHFVKEAGAEAIRNLSVKGASIHVSEWTGPSKAATDNQVVGSVFQTPVLTEFDRTIVRANRPRLVIADLLGAGTISGNAVSYFVEGALEGAFATVAEGGAKPQLHVADPTLATDQLRKIAGFIKFTDEMLEDLDFVVSEINNRLLYELARFEEVQLLNGNGTGQNVLGLLNRPGVQSIARTAGEPTQDALFRATTAISTATGLEADGIGIHPLDYQALRLAKDANGQYFGGGMFTGPYGVGGVMENPPLWGLRTVVSPAFTQGEALVGAFRQAATVYRKGGVRVESTNSHASDFTNNLVTTRAEERVALAVRVPGALAKVNLAPAV